MATDKKVKRSIASVESYKTTFNTEDGQKVLWDLMKLNGFLDDGYVQADPYSTVYNEGRRSVVLHIINRLNIDTKKLLKKYEEGIRDDQGLFDSIDE